MAQLSKPAVQALLELDVPLRLGTIDQRGFPRVTPIWFLYDDGVFYMSSVVGKRHLRDLERDPRASVRIDVEEPIAVGGVRRNQQVGGRGFAELRPDREGEWTRRITLKYVTGPEGAARATLRAAQPRVLIVFRPEKLEAIGT